MKDPAQVLTTIRSLSRQAHNYNASISVIGPKLAAPGPRTTPTKSIDIPAWNTTQYGFISESSSHIGGRRDVVPHTRKPPPPPPKLTIKSKIPGPASTKRPPPVPKKHNVFGEEQDVKFSSSSSSGKSSTIKSDSRQNLNIQLMAHGLQSQRQIETDTSQAEEYDPSIFGYDEVYEEMNQAKREAKRIDLKDKKVSTCYFEEEKFPLTQY